jgi:hypothetical protein
LKLIPVKSGEKWGYISPKGEYVVNPQFRDATVFHDGLAKVVATDGKVGYIKDNGEYAIAAKYKNGTLFFDGLAFVVEDGGYPTCIDKSGKTKFVLKEAKIVCGFSEGLALFSDNENKYGFVDKSGKIVVNPQFDGAWHFNEGFAILVQDGKCGFIDKTGKIVINPQFDLVSDFKNGKAAFKNGNQWGFIDTKGSYIINPQFDNVGSFSEGYAPFKQGSDWGYINEKGKIEINPQFDRASDFKSGLAYVEQGNKYGYINPKGQFEINPQFEETSDFFGSFALVKSAGKWGIIDKKGKYLVNPQFDDVKTQDFNTTPVQSDFYDTSEFISKFFERTKGNSFDGVNASSTLQDLINNATYGDGVNASYDGGSHVLEYKKTQKLTDEISISKVSFLGSDAFYTGSYYNKEYNFDAKVSSIEYVFYLSGEARSKTSAIVNALIAEIQQRYNIKLQYTTDESGDSEYDWYEGSNDSLYFMLIPAQNLELRINFQRE